MLDNDAELMEYRARIERRFTQRRHGVRRRHTGRRRADVLGTLAAAFPPDVLIIFAGLLAIVGGTLAAILAL